MTSEKEKLYAEITGLRNYFFLPITTPINTISFFNDCTNTEIEYAQFKTQGLCGIAMVGQEKDMIVLNKSRTEKEQNFDCAHELIHLYKHRKLQDSFNCFTKTKPNQNSFLEWQANEGAAQWLIPYQDFIPRFVSYIDKSSGTFPCTVLKDLSEHYQTTPQVIRNRISSLNFEIDQYRKGIPISEIIILSKRQLDRRDMHPTDYTALCDWSLSWDAMIG